MPKIFIDNEKNFLEYRVGSGRTIEIFDIVVGTDRRKGIGTQLIQKLLERIPDDISLVFAITRVSNLIAQQFYEANEFRIVGRLHNFYQDGPEGTESALMYGLDV